MVTAQPVGTNRKGGVERWLDGHGDLAAMLVVVLGFLARLWAAAGTFLNPDEALHFRLANESSLALVYKASLTALHPPLLFLLLHLWRGLGTSELWLRLPSVVAGTVFCWLFFKWLSQVAGRLTGLLGLMLVALLPPEVMLSAEMRQYALLLAFLAGALYFLERAFGEDSAGPMLASALCLYLAMLTHYSAFLFAAALGAYGLSKMFTPPAERPRASVVASWVVGQLCALALCVFLYKTHLSQHGTGDSAVLQEWIAYLSRSSYFQPGRDNPLLFAVGRSFGVFQYLFGQLAVGIVMGLAFLAGLGLILRGRGLAGNVVPSRRLAIILILPFVLACAASFLHAYPYGGTRHVSFLIMPATAGISVAMARLASAGSTGAGPRGERWTRGVAITALVVAVCITFGKQRRPSMERADQSRAHMAAAIEFIQTKIASSDLIFTDYQSDLLLGHYLCGQRTIPFDTTPPPGFEQFSCGAHRIVSKDYTRWQFWANNFIPEWQRFVETYQLKPGSNVWIVQAGWSVELPEELRRNFVEFHDLHFESFGDNIKMFKLAVGQPGNRQPQIP